MIFHVYEVINYNSVVDILGGAVLELSHDHLAQFISIVRW